MYGSGDQDASRSPVGEVLENISDGFLAVDEQWRVIYLNAAAEVLLGRRRDQTRGLLLWEAYPGLAGDGLIGRELRRAMGEGVTVDFEGLYEPRGQWLKGRAYPRRGGDGRPGLSVSFADVTEARRVREALHELESRHGRLFEALGHGVVHQDATGTMLDANPAAQRILGRSLEELCGVSSLAVPWECVREDGSEFPGPEHPAMRALATGRPVSGEIMGVRRGDTGARVWINIASTPTVPPGSDRAVGTYTTFSDITDRIEALAAARRAEQRYRSLVLATAQVVWLTDPQGRVIPPMSSWTAITGQPPEEYAGHGWLAAVHPDDRARASATWAGAVAARTGYEVEYRLRTRTGEYRHFLARGAPVVEGGEVREWVGTCTDIHDKAVAAGQLREAMAAADRSREAAEAASNAKDRFLAVLSHELRTPLNPALLAVTSLAADDTVDVAVREELEMVRRNLDLEARLIDDMLDLSRVVAGKLRLELRPARAHALIADVVRIFEAPLREKQIVVASELHAGDDSVTADPARLQQVFWNLLSNAVKFTPAGGRITVGTQTTEAGQLRVTVADTGAGIRADVLDRVFNAFDQGDHGVTRRFGGLGLGLAISKALVDMHGGTLRAASEGPGRGATFTVELPVSTAASVADGARPMGGAAAAGAALRVLLVDDHADTLGAVRRVLERRGMVVATAGSVAAGVRLLGEQTFDVLVSDIGLPDGTGHDLMRAARRMAGGGPPGIAVSGYGTESDVEMSREAGFVLHLTKPLGVAALTEAIRKAGGRAG